MSEPLFEPDIDMPVRLPWDTICKLAVKALCLGLSLNDVCNLAIEQATRRAA